MLTVLTSFINLTHGFPKGKKKLSEIVFNAIRKQTLLVHYIPSGFGYFLHIALPLNSIAYTTKCKI